MSAAKTKMTFKGLAGAKRIESPLARYNSNGQLFCVACSAPVKNEIYWTGHINGKGHRDNVTLLKNKATPSPSAPSLQKLPVTATASFKQPAAVSSLQKRPATSSSILQKQPAAASTASSLRKQPASTPSSSSALTSISNSSSAAEVAPTANGDGNEISSAAISSSSNDEQTYLAPYKRLKLEDINISPLGPPPSILKKHISYSSTSKLESQPPMKTYKQIEEEEALMEIDAIISTTTTSRLDDDDDDDDEEAEPSLKTHNDSLTLPAGFFDDAKEDAKARGMEYKNPDEAEWDKFVKEIASEDVKSSVLRTADEEDSAKDRELDEIEEQMKNWQRVVQLEKKAAYAKEKLLQDKETMQEGENMSEEEEVDEDYDDDLDWRTKKKH